MGRLALQQYIKLSEFLGAALGPDYEVALYDLSTDDYGIIALANGQVSGRTVGAPLTGVGLQMVSDKVYEDVDYRENYSGVSLGGKMLRSSTLFIKDDNGTLLGMLCINFDDSRYQDLSDQLLKLRHPDVFVEGNFVYNEERVRKEVARAADSEMFRDSISAVTQDLVNQAIQKMGAPPERLTLEERMDLMRLLKEKGVFKLKGAVKEVAQLLQSSPATVYRYLSKLEEQDGE